VRFAFGQPASRRSPEKQIGIQPAGVHGRPEVGFIGVVNLKFPSKLLYRVLESVEEQGFCVLGAEEMERLFSKFQGGFAARREALEEFAILSGLTMETTPNLNAARFENPLSRTAMRLTLQSPVSDAIMHLSEIEPSLLAYACPKSGGTWIPLQSYLDWKEHHARDQSEVPTKDIPSAADDSKRRALICPESGHLLIRYKVGHGLPFHVDVSPKTGGIWLDRGEWEALKNKGLHLELNHIFTAPYQHQVRAEEHEAAMDRLFRDKIGCEDFERVVEFKRWLSSHPKRRSIRAYLLYELPNGSDDF